MSRESDQYETAARQILHNLREHLGLEYVGGKTKYPGRTSRTEWSIDSSGYRAKTGGLVLIECRRYTKDRIKQEEVAAFAYRVSDIGADGGLIVTPIGFQEGAQLVADAELIGLVRLNPEATESDYVLEIAGQIFRGLSVFDSVLVSDSVEVSVVRAVADSGTGEDGVSVEKWDPDTTGDGEHTRVAN